MVPFLPQIHGSWFFLPSPISIFNPAVIVRIFSNIWNCCCRADMMWKAHVLTSGTAIAMSYYHINRVANLRSEKHSQRTEMACSSESRWNFESHLRASDGESDESMRGQQQKEIPCTQKRCWCPKGHCWRWWHRTILHFQEMGYLELHLLWELNSRGG